MGRAVSNDLLATALSVLVLVILLQQGRSWRYPLAALLAGLACLTKLTAVFAVGIIVIAYLLEFRQHPERRKALLRPGLVMLAVFAATAALIGLVPILREHFQTGLRAFSATMPAARTGAYWGDVLQLSASSGWARFGWMNVAAPAWQAYAWWLFILAGVIAGIASLWRQRPALFLVAILVLWVAAVLAGYIRINLNRFQPQFRFAFALLPVLGTFAAGGYRCWLRRQPSLAVVLLALALFLVNLWLIFQLVIPAYTI
jgi:hypothetical protein